MHHYNGPFNQSTTIMLSYWEQQSLLKYDHIIIGSGIVGLSLAIELKEKYPAHRVLVLERGLLPTGASTRNAGFACMGSPTEVLDDLTYMSEAEVVALFEKRKQGLDILRSRLGDERIGYRTGGSFELINTDELYILDRLNYLNELIKPVTQTSTFTVANEKIKQFGFSAAYAKALIENRCEGELHTGKMMRALTDFALSKSIEIKTGARVTGFEEEENHVVIFMEDNLRQNTLKLCSKTLAICTNAFTKQLLPGEIIAPGRGQVLITKPINNLKFKGIFHFDKGYYYFREVDGRVLFGGGRNLDFEHESTTEFGENELILNDLKSKLKEIILPTTPFEIDMQWSGIMAFGNDKQPVVKAISNRIFGAFRMGGMGVALGSKVAEELAEKINI